MMYRRRNRICATILLFFLLGMLLAACQSDEPTPETSIEQDTAAESDEVIAPAEDEAEPPTVDGVTMPAPEDRITYFPIPYSR